MIQAEKDWRPRLVLSIGAIVTATNVHMKKEGDCVGKAMRNDQTVGKLGIGNKRVKIRGVLIPMAWDEMGQVARLGLSGVDERQYLIAKNEKAEELFKLLQKEVELSGLLREQAGNKMILVKRWSRVSSGTYPKSEERR